MSCAAEETVPRSLLDEIKAAQQSLIYAVSHDLRAPLVNLLGFANEIDNDVGILTDYLQGLNADLPAEIDDIVRTRLPMAAEFLTASTDKLQQLLDGVLALSRSLAEEIHPEAVCWQEVISTIDENRCTILTSRLGDIPPVIADRAALTRLVGHLFDNAVRFAHPDRVLQINIAADLDVQTLTLCVQDNGRGIAERDLEEIFTLFRRSGKQVAPSYGVGLTICKSMVERMHGRIWCESDGDSYTRVLIQLPLASEGVRVKCQGDDNVNATAGLLLDPGT